MSPGDEFELRRYRPGDEAAIIALFEATFGRTMGTSESFAHWRWEFLENPARRQEILLAFSGDTLAAQYAVLPTRLQVGDREHDAALSLDTATAAAFRGRGLFPRLARQLYREAADAGSVAVFGFPNVNSAPILFHKLGWTELAPFPLLVKPLEGAASEWLQRRGAAGRLVAPLAEIALAATRRRVPTQPGNLALDEVRSFPSDTDALWERARRGKRICVVRSRAYLDWRYANHPDRPYRIYTLREGGGLVGILVTRRQDRSGFRSGFLLDLLCDENRPEVAAVLVGAAENQLRGEGAHLLTALMYPGTVAHAALARAGFRSVPARLLPQEIHFGVCTLTKDLSLTDPRHWYLTWGDSDVI
jgi:hypothetical protein